MSRRPFLCSTLALALLSGPLLAEPQWIWSSQKATSQDRPTFRKSFSVPDGLKSAILKLTCDNGATAFVNGKQVAVNPDWQQPTQADVKAALQAGVNELTINAANEGGTAALVLVLTMEDAAGKKTMVESGPDWEVAPQEPPTWQPAVVIAKYGAGPWGDVFGKGPRKGGESNAPGMATAAKDIVTLPGFRVDLLYTVPKAEQGSWVSMTTDPQGRLLVGDQYGGIYRVTLPDVTSTTPAEVEPLDLKIGGAHGLLYAGDSLYVMVNEKSAPTNKGLESGLYRLKDAGQGVFGAPNLLRAIRGGGEHGPHTMILSPDGRSLYLNCGNHTELPEGMENSRPARVWGEDHLLPRMWDANGHARGRLAPGGYIAKTDLEGKKVELFCYGFRNQFDIAFNGAGELFTFDADMEWDLGSPWYRPTRINHCVSGADYGWRSGSGKWPVYYPDSLPATVDIGPGSPTGVAAGTGAAFPAKYQRAIYAADWTYGTMYAIHSTPKGGTYESVKEEFISGKPLPLTDVLIHPQDGAMYFAVGGRRTQSALYRVTYTGGEPVEPAKPLALTPEMQLRKQLEKYHVDASHPDAIGQAWPHLSHPDRFVRYAARVAIEKQPVELWRDKATTEGSAQGRIEALVALSRVGDKSLQPRIIESLGTVDYNSLNADLQLQYLRAWQLALVRMGKPTPDVCDALTQKFDPLYPQNNNAANQELCQILIFLDSKQVVAKTLGLMATAADDSGQLATDSLLARNTGYAKAAGEVQKSRPNQQQIAYMFALRNARLGWTPELRQAYFSWFPRARQWKGGNSFKGFVENTRQEALVNFVPDAERARLDELSSKVEGQVAANFVAPKGPGKAYTVEDVLKLAEGGLKGRNYETGKAMFTSTMCLTCHRFNDDGGSIGPDVTGSGNRYTLRDLLENIIDPSKVISDQYDSHQITKKDGSLVIGRAVAEENGVTMVMMNPFAPTQLTGIKNEEILEKKTYPVSMMPPGLINTLNEDEVLDLLAYILAAGNPADPRFAK
jgi:putative heme-binding domain-containing protein